MRLGVLWWETLWWCWSKNGKKDNEWIKWFCEQMSYIMIMFNDCKYSLKCEFEEMLRECGYLLEVSGKSFVD